MDKFNQGLLGMMGQPAFQLGVGLLGRNDRPFGQALGGAMQDLQRNQLAQQAAEAQRQRIEAAKQEQARLAQQQQWISQNMPGLAAAPQWAQKEAYKARQPMPPAEAPSNVREWEYFSKLTPQQQQQYLTMKRANQWLDRGPEHVMPNPLDPNMPAATMPKDLAPEDRPETRAAQAAAVESAKGSQQTQSELSTRMARLPGLLTLVDELSELGEKATYTKAGQVYDAARTQLGIEPREAAVARAEYISKVDNEILPLLRETFGSQFTEREGQSLKATLGDPDKSPQEKEAVLRSFIAAKLRDIQMLERKAGVKPTVSAVPTMNTTPKVVDFNDLP